MSGVRPFTDEQSRLLVNLRQRYEVWIDAERIPTALPYDLRRKHLNGRHYLYRIFDRGGNGKSFGAMTPEREAEFAAYHQAKDQVQERIKRLRPVLAETAAMYRALRLPLLSSDAGPILRECDRRQLLGSHLLFVGTNAIVAYMIEANGIIDLPDETEDFDLAWVSETPEDTERCVCDMLKAVDATFTVNSDLDFQSAQRQSI